MKRAFDVTGSLVAFVVFAPLFLGVALLVRWRLGTPVFFTQTRIGKGERPFKLIKFRSMRDATDAEGNPLPDDERLTTFGKFLRASSFDEMPELWNILKGEMSFVGPRPLLPEYLPLYTDEQARRHEVAPGLTGLAQVSGRNAQSFEERFVKDVEYVDAQSLWLDIRILFATVRQVLSREGVTAEGHVTCPRFTGEPGNRPRGLLVAGAVDRVGPVIERLRAAGESIDAVLTDETDAIGHHVSGVPVLGPLSMLAHKSGRRVVLTALSVTERAALRSRFDCVWSDETAADRAAA